MGNSRWSADEYVRTTKSYEGKSRDQVFTSRKMVDELDPSKIAFRESVDSEQNPSSTPIILASDVTGSMGQLADDMIRKGLGRIMDSLYTHKPVPDPHICCMATGDATCDQAPLQVTQFEADAKALTEQLSKVYIEQGGGGNGGESYSLAWWFGLYKVRSDAIQKRGRKGYLFTIGDECCLSTISKTQIRDFMGVGSEVDIPVKELLERAQEHWHIFHLIVNPVGYQPVVTSWRALLGERAIQIRNIDKIAEAIVTIMANVEGVSSDVAADFDDEGKKEAENVRKALPVGGAA